MNLLILTAYLFGQCVGYPKEKLHDNSFWELTCVHLHILYSCESRGKVLHNAQSNRSLAASHSRGTKPPCWRAKSQWNKPTNKGKYHLKILYAILFVMSQCDFALQHGGFVSREWPAAKGLFNPINPF